MEIEQVKKLKRSTEETILEVIKIFEDATGLVIEDVGLNQLYGGGVLSGTQDVRVRVEV